MKAEYKINALKVAQERLLEMAKAYDRGMNEGGEGYNPYDQQISDITDQIVALQQQAEDEEWTLEVTQKRRESWNDWIKSLGGGMMDARTLSAHCDEIGYGPDTIKRHIKRHGLV